MDDPDTRQGHASIPVSDKATAPLANDSMRHADEAIASTKDAAGNIAEQTSDTAGSLVDQVKEKAFAVAADQKEGLADRIDDIAQAVHKSGEQFAGQQDWIASAIERGASELGALASSLRQNDLAGLIGQVRSLAQRQPALFVGASLAAGFAVARLGKLVAADVSRDDLPTMPEVRHGGR